MYHRYDWVDIGVLDYDPATKRYLVKRVRITEELQECERETLSRQSQRSQSSRHHDDDSASSHRKPRHHSIPVHSTSPRRGPSPELKLQSSEPKLENVGSAASAKVSSSSRLGSGVTPVPEIRGTAATGAGDSRTSLGQRVSLTPVSGPQPPPPPLDNNNNNRKAATDSRRSLSPKDACPALDGDKAHGGDLKPQKQATIAAASMSPAKRALKGVKMKKGGLESADGTYHWVPRIRVMFAAEDPRAFASRVADAHTVRQKTEALLRYNLYVDCMPCDGLQQMDATWLQRMLRVARSSERLRRPAMDACASGLSEEMQLEFTRTMGRIQFDKTVQSQPGSFPFVTLPDPTQEVTKDTGIVSQHVCICTSLME